MSNASLSFLPWVRQGVASAIDEQDTSSGAQPPVATVSAVLTLNSETVPNVDIALRGPGDVIGIDPNQIVRTDPRPGTMDFESNCFASIEFDRPDFPWLFTPLKASDADRLRPWLCLVVVRKQDGVTLDSTSDAPVPRLRIASPASWANELPDLVDSWAWAHAQVAADDATDAKVREAFDKGPELTLSRLVCPRFLAPQTDYIACVVPTFEVGRRLAIGDPVSATDTASWNLAPAWSSATPAGELELPVFYHWEFRTGEQGDFESLARRLTATVPEGLGTKTIDVSRPGFDAAGTAVVDLEGALLPIPPVDPPPASDPVTPGFKANLAAIINQPGQTAATSTTADPVLAPPMYGRWHAGQGLVDPSGTSWLDQLNLDPRWRVAAALGTRVVQEHQEALMASAWEQAAELRDVNQRMRQLQLSMAVGEVLHERHFTSLDEEVLLRMGAPAFGRIGRPADGASLLAQQQGTTLPVGANRTAMRRIGRLRGPLTRRITTKGFRRSRTATWVASLNQMTTADQFDPAPSIPPAPPPLDFATLPPLTQFTQALEYSDPGHLPGSFYGAFFVAPENSPVTAPGVSAFERKVEVPDLFRSAAREHLSAFFPARPFVVTPHFIVFESFRDLVLASTNPRSTLQKLASAIVSTGDGVLAATAPDVEPTGVEGVMAAPHFPHPMYETLRELSQDLLLPGLDRIKPDTVLGLRTNRRFVEAFMVGLNHEMARELLWRGYPTDQRGTYFDHFWGNGVPNTAPADITPLHSWSAADPVTKKLLRQLGDTVGAPETSEEFVLVMRSSLLRRYPNAVIRLVPAQSVGDALVPDDTEAAEVAPVFSGGMQPDIVFFGFPVSTAAATGADGTAGWYVVIQEHPTEPRFGVDDDFAKTGTHLAVTTAAPPGLDPQGWNTNAAQMARITRRLPIRMAIHAKRLITTA